MRVHFNDKGSPIHACLHADITTDDGNPFPLPITRIRADFDYSNGSPPRILIECECIGGVDLDVTTEANVLVTTLSDGKKYRLVEVDNEKQTVNVGGGTGIDSLTFSTLHPNPGDYIVCKTSTKATMAQRQQIADTLRQLFPYNYSVVVEPEIDLRVKDATQAMAETKLGEIGSNG